MYIPTFVLNFEPSFNIPTTLKLQDAVRAAPSVAVHATVLVPRGKEPSSLKPSPWSPVTVKEITPLVGDRAVHSTFTVPQSSSAVGCVNVTNLLTPVDTWFMGCGH